MTRTLQVDVTDLAETMDYAVAEGMAQYVDLRTGAIIPGDEAPLEPEHLLQIPPFGKPYRYQRMVKFAATVEGELAALIEVALQGEGAFRRFKNLVHHHGLADAWYGFQLELDRTEAMIWLASHDLDVIDISTRLPPAPAGPLGVTVGLADLLLLGAPDGKTELIEGQVRRRIAARSPGHARELFTRLHRDVCAAAGMIGPDPTGDSGVLDAGRFHLRRYEDAVELDIDVPRELWDRFGG